MMTKVKTGHGIFDNGDRNVKNGTTNKKKRKKFTKKSNGKISLINGSQDQSNGNTKNQKNGVHFQWQTKLWKGDNKPSASLEASTSGVKFPQVKIKPHEEKDTVPPEDTGSFDKDINERITIKEEDEEVDADSLAKDAVENDRIKMFECLNQEIKEEPFSDDAEDTMENKGIKIFENVKQEVKEEPCSGNDNDDDDEEEESKEDEKAAPGLAALLGGNIASDSDDEDFEAMENDSDDDDEDDEDDEYDEDCEDLPPNVAIFKSEKNYENYAVNQSACRATESITGKKECHERTLLISNVPKDSDISALRKEFGRFGIMESMTLRGNVPVNPNLPGKVAAVLKKNRRKTKTVSYSIRYKNKGSVMKALSMNRMKWDGKILKVKVSHPRETFDKTKAVFLTHLPPTIQDKEIRKLFKQCGPINALNIFRSRKSGLARGRGYVNFASVDGAVAALNLDRTTMKNHEIRIMPDVAAWRKEQCIQKNKKKPKRTEKTKTVYLTNLPFTIEDNDLWKLFKQCGPINSLKIMRNSKNRECGLITFGSVEGAMMAMGLNGTTIKNHEIRILPDYTVARKEQRQIEKENRKRSLSGTAGSPSRKKRKTTNLEATNKTNAEKRKVKKRIKKRLEAKKQRIKANSSPHGKGKGKVLGQKADAKKKPKQNKSAKKKKQTAP